MTNSVTRIGEAASRKERKRLCPTGTRGWMNILLSQTRCSPTLVRIAGNAKKPTDRIVQEKIAL
jgi:hypothetical protein